MTPIDRPLSVLALMVSLTFVHPIFFLGVVVMTLDCTARYETYFRLRGHQWQPGLAYQMRGSWCSRGVAEYIWRERAKSLYHTLGYRWYHVFPDGAPRVFFRTSFWKHVIGWR